MLTDFRERGRERGRNTDVRDKHPIICLICTPTGDWTRNFRCVPWLEIEPVTFWFMGWYSNQLSHIGQGFLFCFVTASMSKGYFQIVPDYISALVQGKDKTVYICLYSHLFLTSASFFSHDSNKVP